MSSLFSKSPLTCRPDQVGSPLGHGKDNQSEPKYDYIIVGGGTAGCVLASRLSEDPFVSVLLLERGPIADTWESRVPMISANSLRDRTLAVMWKSKPMPQVDNRELDLVVGETLGGGSRVNSMVYTRGAPADFNAWAEMGHPEWNYDKMQPYFVKSEKSLSQPKSFFRGHEGVWQNQTYPVPPYKIFQQVEKACKSVGIPAVSDINSPFAPAVGYATLDVATDHTSQRHSTYRAFLPSALTQSRRNNLKICPEVLAQKIETNIDEKSGRPRATAVQFQAVNSTGDPTTYSVKARKEIIVCGGALYSPQILQISGIGPKDLLQSLDVPVVQDLPGVGNNLDHISVPVMFEIPLTDSLHVLQHSMWRVVIELLKYLVLGLGLFSFGYMQTSIFLPSRLLNTNSEIVDPDPSQLDSTNPENIADVELMPMANNCSDIQYPGKGIFSFLTALVKPKAVGTVRITSKDARVRPEVDLGFLKHEEDYAVLRKCVKLGLRLGEQIKAQGTYPLFKNLHCPESESIEDLDKFIRTNLRSTLHYSSTCRMGKPDEDKPGVVDDELRVHGVDGLRVCDTSVFPEIIATHTMAPVVAVAEKCADLIRGAARS